MKKVLLTGGSGFIGRNMIPILKEFCQLYAPNRAELNLLDANAVKQYIIDHEIQVVIHSANPNPSKNVLDSQDRMFEDSVRVFLNLYQAQDHYEMMYTLGSGAEFDKRMDIVSISEEDEFRSIPQDVYGLAKFTNNRIISTSPKQCNLRIFACYGPTDADSKFITHCIRCCLRGEDITIRQNCYFDYMHVYDLARIMEYFIYHKPKYRSYNVCSGTRKTLKEIAQEVHRQMNSQKDIVLLADGWNKEYTGSNRRLLEEIGDYRFITLEEGVRMQIESELSLEGQQK